MTNESQKKWLKINSLFLGLSMLTFGLLKFVSPFREWYATQVFAAELPAGSFQLGIFGEIAIGILLTGPYFIGRLHRYKHHVLLFGSLGLAVMMGVATYVHIHPNVPADVLPLKIKPPIIPLVFFALATMNGIWSNVARLKNKKSHH